VRSENDSRESSDADVLDGLHHDRMAVEADHPV